jgi:hypothetical protein
MREQTELRCALCGDNMILCEYLIADDMFFIKIVCEKCAYGIFGGGKLIEAQDKPGLNRLLQELIITNERVYKRIDKVEL